MTRTIVVTPPAALLTPDIARARLGLSTAVVDDTLIAYIAVATSSLDCPGGWLGRALGSQTLETQTDVFPGHEHHRQSDWIGGSWNTRDCRHDQRLRLSFPPIAGIVSINYVDPIGTSVELDPSTYVFDGERTLVPVPGLAWPATAGTSNNVRIRYTCGYAPEALPAAIGQAIVLGVAKQLASTRSDLSLKQDVVIGVSSQTFETVADVGATYDRAIAALLDPAYRVFE